MYKKKNDSFVHVHMKYKILLVLFLGFISLNTRAQTSDSIIIPKDSLIRHELIVIQDSTKTDVHHSRIATYFKRDYPSPKKAVLFSLIIPGSGQIYNKKYWKVPIVYGGFYLGYRLIDFNIGKYRYYKEGYFAKLNNLPHALNKTEYTAESIKRVRDAYYKQLQQSYVFTTLWYFLTAIDAFVDAHLATFDVSDDLSIQLHPAFQLSPVGKGNFVGIGLNIPLKH